MPNDNGMELLVTDIIPTFMAESATTKDENPVRNCEGLVILHHLIDNKRMKE